MTPGTHARADAPTRGGPRPGPPGLGWRIGTPVVILLSGALFAVSATNSEGTDLRPGRYTDLASLVKTESDQYDVLEDRVRELDAEVDRLASAVEDGTVKRLRERIDQMEDPAGLTLKAGTGIRVVLSDAPEDVINSSEQDIDLLVVHQQDIQAVVNAMWKGGATAVTLQGQRIISTTGIKCEGNSVVFGGRPFPQPYVIEAVGSQVDLLNAIEDDDYLDLYRAQAAVPDIGVGWELSLEDQVVAPAYDSLLDLDYAEPIRDQG